MPGPRSITLTTLSCFGFFAGNQTCGSCTAQKRCKAILISNGADIMSGFVNQLLNALPEGEYPETMTTQEICGVLLAGGVTKLTSEEEEILALQKGKPPMGSDINIEMI